MSQVEATPQRDAIVPPTTVADTRSRCFAPRPGAAPMLGTIRGLGAALPDGVLANPELDRRFALPPDWIVERCGINERRTGGDVASLASEAAARALGDHAADDVDLLILATSTSDVRLPATAADVARRVGLGCATFDLNAACTGFVYALLSAYGFLAIGASNVLVVGADVMTSIVDPADCSTAILFGDGAGAVLVSNDGRADGSALLGWHASTEPAAYDLLCARHDGPIVMDGRAVFRFAVRTMVESASRAMTAAGVTADEIALFVPHQANTRIIAAGCERLGIDEHRTATTLATTGNTSAGSVPIALCAALDGRDLTPGDLVLLTGFGAGMTAATAVIRW